MSSALDMRPGRRLGVESAAAASIGVPPPLASLERRIIIFD
jgi:hypothetical protein